MFKAQKENFGTFDADYKKGKKKKELRAPVPVDEVVSEIVETKKRSGHVGSPTSRRRRNPELPKVEEDTASVQSTQAIQENTSKTGDVLEDDIVGSVGVVDEKTPELLEVSEKVKGGNIEVGEVSATAESPVFVKNAGSVESAKEGKTLPLVSEPELPEVSVTNDQEVAEISALSKGFEDAGSIDDLLIIVSDPDFPGIRGSWRSYSGDDLKIILTWVKNDPSVRTIRNVPRSSGLRKNVVRLVSSLTEEERYTLLQVDVPDLEQLTEQENVAREKLEKILYPDAHENVEGLSTLDAVPKETLGEAEIQKSNEMISDVEAMKEGEGVTMEKEEGESVLEGEYQPKSEQPIDERIEVLEKEISDRRRMYAKIAYQKKTLVGRLQKAFLSKFLPEKSQINSDLQEVRVQYFSTRKALESAYLDRARSLAGSSPEKIKEELVGTLKRFGITESVDLYNAFCGAKFSGGKFEKWTNQSTKWIDEYRKMPLKKKLLLTTAVVGGSALAFGAGGAIGAGVLLRAIGSVGAGRGVFEYLEDIANKHFIKKKQEEESYVKAKGFLEGDEFVDEGKIGFLRRALEIQSGTVEKDFENAQKWRRARVAGGMAVTAGLFFGAPAASRWALEHSHVQELIGSASHAFSKLLEQVKIITGFEGFHGTPVSIGAPISVDAATQTPLVKVETSIPDISGSERPDVLPNTAITRSVLEGNAVEAASDRPEIVLHLSNNFPQTPIPVENVSPKSPIDVNSFFAHADQNVENAKHAFPDMMKGFNQSDVFLKGGDAVVMKGSSIQGTLIEHFRKLGFSDADAGKFASRVSDAFQKDHPNVNLEKVFENTKIHFGSSPESPGPLSAPFKIEGIEFAPSGPHGTPTVVGTMMSEKPAVSTLLQPKPFDIPAAPSSVETPPSASFPKMPEVNLESPQDIFDRVLPQRIPVPSLEDTIKGSLTSDIPLSATGIEATSTTPLPQMPLDSLDLSVPGSEYLKNMGIIVKEKLTFLPLSQGQKNLIESIFSAKIPVLGTEPTSSSVLFVKDALGRALFPSEDVARWIQADVEHIKEKVNRAVYAGIVRIGGESLRIGNMIVRGETVEGWLTKMARYILTHPVEFKK